MGMENNTNNMTNMTQNKVWVAYSQEGWKVKISNPESSLATFQKKNEALERAQQIADEYGAEFLPYTTPNQG